MRSIIKKINNYFNADKKVFAKGICKEKLFFIFLFGCVFGCVYEEFLNGYFSHMYNGFWVFETRRGLIYGELSPIYGWGAAIIVYILCRHDRKWYLNLLYGALIGGTYEYFAGFLQEKFTGYISWDYSKEFLNINGRTTIPFMLVWGLLALVMIYVIYPFLSNLIEKIPYNLGNIMFKVLLILVSIDIVLSFGATIRQGLRNEGYQSITPVGAFYDRVYPDDRLAKSYPNAVRK
jgi:uncharacterized membrane protein